MSFLGLTAVLIKTTEPSVVSIAISFPVSLPAGRQPADMWRLQIEEGPAFGCHITCPSHPPEELHQHQCWLENQTSKFLTDPVSFFFFYFLLVAAEVPSSSSCVSPSLLMQELTLWTKSLRGYRQRKSTNLKKKKKTTKKKPRFSKVSSALPLAEDFLDVKEERRSKKQKLSSFVRCSHSLKENLLKLNKIKLLK